MTLKSNEGHSVKPKAAAAKAQLLGLFSVCCNTYEQLKLNTSYSRYAKLGRTSFKIGEDNRHFVQLLHHNQVLLQVRLKDKILPKNVIIHFA